MLIAGERHLATTLASYTAHYNEHRPHRSLGQRPPAPRPNVSDYAIATVQRRTILGGLINEYSQAAMPNRLCEPTGATWTAASGVDVDIDHVVPLADAWRSGANTWTTGRRQAFANDLTHPQLIAVTDNVNQSKGDQDPSTWQPSAAAHRST
jgi:hypothetical protein